MKQRDYLEWGEVEFLVDRLIEDKQFLIGLFVLIGCATGMKANDILALHWKDVLADVVFFREKSTGRYYYANLKDETKSNIEKIYQGLGMPPLEANCFISRKKCVYSIQRINVLLKQVSKNYLGGKVLFTTTTLRRTFGREYLKHYGANLYNLRMFFDQDTEEFTKNYLRLYTETPVSLPKICAITRQWCSHY